MVSMETRFTVRHWSERQQRRYWMNVVVYDTVAELQAAARQYRPSNEPGYWDNCAGCFQPHAGTRNGYLGIMRLARQNLTATIVIHESVHAAVAFTWQSLGLQRIHLDPYSQRSMEDREEVMAHAVDGISVALLKYLRIQP